MRSEDLRIGGRVRGRGTWHGPWQMWETCECAGGLKVKGAGTNVGGMVTVAERGREVAGRGAEWKTEGRGFDVGGGMQAAGMADG